MKGPSPKDEKLMRRALELAAKGRGWVEPNPMVGAVLVRQGEIVGEGWHRAFGEAHAEKDAILHAGEGGADTLVVNLEPCHHEGKTPPCTETISAAGIERVVIGTRDPNPAVRGGGAEALRGLGIQVDEGCLEEESRNLNAPYEKWVTKKVPYVIAKWAMSLDGRLAGQSGDSRWISSEASRKIVHDLRGEVDAILVGVGTLLADDPRLNCRTKAKRVARRVVADSKGRTPPGCRMLSEGAGAVIVAVTSAARNEDVAALESVGAEVWVLPAAGERVDLGGLLVRLGEEGATNLLVEGGPTLLGEMFRQTMVDRALCFIAPSILGGDAHPISGWGVERAKNGLPLQDVRVSRPGGDLLIEGTVVWGED